MKTVKIDDQIWSTENLDVEHYRNGDIIPEVQDPDEWANLTTGAWCYYYNQSINGKKYGKLYNWYAVSDPRGLAPKGWHIPTMEEFETLRGTVNDNSNPLKAEGEGTGNGVGTNKSGFSALLSGYREGCGIFDGLGRRAACWSSSEDNETDACYLYLTYINCFIYFYDNNKNYGQSVRIIKDEKQIEVGEQLLNNLYIDGIIRNTRAIHLCPENPIFYALRGQLRAMLDDPKGCLEDMRKAIELTPDHLKAKEYNEYLEKILKDYKEENNG